MIANPKTQEDFDRNACERAGLDYGTLKQKNCEVIAKLEEADLDALGKVMDLLQPLAHTSRVRIIETARTFYGVKPQ